MIEKELKKNAEIHDCWRSLASQSMRENVYCCLDLSEYNFEIWAVFISKDKFEYPWNYDRYNGYVTVSHVNYPEVMDLYYEDLNSFAYDNEMDDPHGGLTWSSHDNEGLSVFGFDTAHSYSPKYPITSINWIKDECMKIVNIMAFYIHSKRSPMFSLPNE